MAGFTQVAESPQARLQCHRDAGVVTGRGRHLDRKLEAGRLWTRLGVALGALWATACITPLENRRWIAIETEHFQFLTGDDEASSVQLTREFELFHTFMEEGTGGNELSSSIPTYVLLFASPATYGQFAPPNTAGYSSSSERPGSATGTSSSAARRKIASICWLAPAACRCAG